MDTDVYDEGWKAYKNDLSLEDNPYNRLDFNFEDWERGWIDAQSLLDYSFDLYDVGV